MGTKISMACNVVPWHVSCVVAMNGKGVSQAPSGPLSLCHCSFSVHKRAPLHLPVFLPTHQCSCPVWLLALMRVYSAVLCGCRLQTGCC
jgi:hypothetical protein